MKNKKWWRLALLAIVLVAIWVVADQTGLRESMTEERIQALVTDAGPLGVVAYVAIFSVGQLVQLPGVLFVLAARVAYGPFVGFAAAYAGALAAVSLTFFVVRSIGGKPLDEVKWRPARRMLARLEDRPVITIVLLRSVLALSPPLNYALAMSKVRFREYFAGSALGLAAPLAVWVFLSDWLISLFGCLS